LGRFSSDLPDWTNPALNKVKKLATRMESQEIADRMQKRMGGKDSTSSQDSLSNQDSTSRMSRSTSLPQVGPKLQRNAVSMLNGNSHMSMQKSAADATMPPIGFAQHRQRSCAAAPRRLNIKKADNADALAEFLNEWDNKQCARGKSRKTNKELTSSTDSTSTSPTTCPGSPATSCCSSSFSSVRGTSYRKPDNGIPYAAKLFGLLDQNDNRLIDKEEWSLFFEIAGRGSIFHDILRFVYKAADVDEDGKLDEHEWMNYVEGVIAKIGTQAWGEMANKVIKELKGSLTPQSPAVRAALGEKPHWLEALTSN